MGWLWDVNVTVAFSGKGRPPDVRKTVVSVAAEDCPAGPSSQETVIMAATASIIVIMKILLIVFGD